MGLGTGSRWSGLRSPSDRSPRAPSLRARDATRQSSGMERRPPTGPIASGNASEPARTRQGITSWARANTDIPRNEASLCSSARRRVSSGGAYFDRVGRRELARCRLLLSMDAASALTPEQVLDAVGSRGSGLTATEVAERSDRFGPNAVRSHHASALPVLRPPAAQPAAVAAARRGGGVVLRRRGHRRVIIGVIVAASVGLGFVNEYRAETAAEALHSADPPRGRRRRATASPVERRRHAPGARRRRRTWSSATIVPADLRLLAVERPGVRRVGADRRVAAGRRRTPTRCRAARRWPSCRRALFMGTVVHAGSGARRGRRDRRRDRVRADRRRARASTTRRPSSRSGCAGSRCCWSTVGGVADRRDLRDQRGPAASPIIDALLFSLAIAVGITPQLLPAVVVDQPGHRVAPAGRAQGAGQTAGLHRGPRRRRRAVHRQDRHPDRGPDQLRRARSTRRRRDAPDVLALGPAVHRGTVDRRARPSAATRSTPALWDSPAAAASDGRPSTAGSRVAAVRPRAPDGLGRCVRRRDGARTLITKGAPEAVLDRCVDVPADGAATRSTPSSPPATAWSPSPPGPPPTLDRTSTGDDEHDLHLAGLLVFLDPPKPDAAAVAAPGSPASASRSRSSPATTRAVAAKVCRDLGLPAGGDAHRRRPRRPRRRRARRRASTGTTVFARVSPEQKARIVRAAAARRRRRSRSSATASTTRSRCTPPTSASRSTRPPTSPRTPPTSSCSRRTSTCSPTASSKAAGSSPTPSSTS